TGTHRVYQPPKGPNGIGEVHQESTAVDEVIVGRFQLVLENVVPANFEVGQPVSGEEARVEVGRHDAPLAPDAPGQPAGHRAIACGHVEATPARPDPPGRSGGGW